MTVSSSSILESMYCCIVMVILVPGIHGQRKEHLVSAVCACVKFSKISGKLWYFGILQRNGHLQWQWRQVLISLGLTHDLHKWRSIQWLEAIEKWPCADCLTFYSVMLHDDVLLENIKYGCIIMQNNGAVLLVNFTHAQTAETRHSFCRPWTPGTRLSYGMICSPWRPWLSAIKGPVEIKLPTTNYLSPWSTTRQKSLLVNLENKRFKA